MTTTQITRLAIDVWQTGNKFYGGDKTAMLEWAGDTVRQRFYDNATEYGFDFSVTDYEVGDITVDEITNQIHAVVMGLITLLRSGIINPSQLDRAIHASI